ncbi:S1/P1 nuclease [Ferruginibacter sp. SUN002]|uniref:S1/P1 nuclease n=1 Tax=Ferruginibacter sp. SUN002 TaxID=2937789 RepID=UPI003D36B548
MKVSYLYTTLCRLVRHGFLALVLFFSLSPKNANAWGPKGHTIVGQIAMQLLSAEVRANVLSVLNGMPIDTAANWMDIQRSNSDYDFMKPWHYIDFGKDVIYAPSTDENSVNKIIAVFNELRHKHVLCDEQIKMDLLILIHLMGDLSQPLHNGYDDDLGGNKRPVQLDTLKTNLHHFWDENIIDLRSITFEDCMALYKSMDANKIDSIEGIHPALWMKESRSLLPKVYDFSEYIITDAYVDRSAAIVKRQLLIAGVRLANMLTKLFTPEAAPVDAKLLAAKYKNGIDAKDAAASIGKKITACSKVFGVKSLENVTFINMGAKAPNSPLTIVVFAKDVKNFKPSIEELYNNKNICVIGTVVEYKGKVEIIVSSPSDIIVQ